MIVFKINKLEKFEEIHADYFDSLLNTLKDEKLLSQSIDEIIITDEIREEIIRYSANRFRIPNLTRNREFFAIAKTVDFKGKKKVFFDALSINNSNKTTPQNFYTQLLDIYAEDMISKKYETTNQFYSNTPLLELIKIFLSEWASKTISSKLLTRLSYHHQKIYDDIKIYVDAFKRNIRRLHYKYQKDTKFDDFWIKTLTELDAFIRRCQDVKYDNGNFENLQEFSEIIPPFLNEIETQTHNLLEGEDINYENIRKSILAILKICLIEIPDEVKMGVKIIDTPKKLFRKSLVDTEPCIVAFIDILGFSSIIEEYDTDDYSNILNELHDTLEQAINISIERMTDSKIKNDLNEYLEYRMFSDCICISLPFIEFGNDFHIQFHSLSHIVKAYQLAMIQKGFFVRGGISQGSYFSDKNMIFSGALVKAYKQEQTSIYPVISLDESVLKRLNHNFTENSKGLLFENALLYKESEPELVFLNPFDYLNNPIKYFDYLQSTMENLISSNKEEEDSSLSGITSSLLEITNSITKPIFEIAKSQLKPENMDVAKEAILRLIDDQIKKQILIMSSTSKDNKIYKEAEKVIIKFKYMKSLLDWTLNKNNSNVFKNYNFDT